MLAEEICEAVVHPEVVASLAEDLRRVEFQTSWLEEVLRVCKDDSGQGGAIRVFTG